MALVEQTMTEKNLEAHRRNGRQSHGAATPEGKERARAANLRHGYYSDMRDDALVALGEDPADLAALVGREPDPADLAERQDLCGELARQVAQLPANQREAVDLWCEGFTYREISQIAGQSEGNVRVLVHRAIKQLREKMKVTR